MKQEDGEDADDEDGRQDTQRSKDPKDVMAKVYSYYQLDLS